jgi:hypothetical protein
MDDQEKRKIVQKYIDHLADGLRGDARDVSDIFYSLDKEGWLRDGSIHSLVFDTHFLLLFNQLISLVYVPKPCLEIAYADSFFCEDYLCNLSSG